MGSPLKDTVFYALVDNLIKMHVNANNYKNRCFYYKDFLNVIETGVLNYVLDQKIL